MTMRVEFLILLIFLFITKVNSQIIFEYNQVVTTTDGNQKFENLNNKIIINSDTTEVEIHFKSIKINEKIFELYSQFDDENYKILVYKKEGDELLILHLLDEIVFSIVFQKDNYNRLEFEIKK